MYNEQTRHRKSHEEDKDDDYSERSKNTQDAVFDLDNCLQERRSRDDNKDDYKMTIGESKTIFEPSITSKQFSLYGTDAHLDANQIYQNMDLMHLNGMIKYFLTSNILNLNGIYIENINSYSMNNTSAIF